MTDEWEKIILATTIIPFIILHVDSLYKLKNLKIITIDVTSSFSFSFDIILQLSAKPASPAHIAKQEQTAVNRVYNWAS